MCKEKSMDKQYKKLCYLPAVFVFHVKRFSPAPLDAQGQVMIDPNTKKPVEGEKIERSFEYPKTLDLQNYQDSKANIDDQSTKYKLIGLVKHLGQTISLGHYISYTLRDNQWWEFNDDRHEKVSESSVLENHRTDVYYLFYQRVN